MNLILPEIFNSKYKSNSQIARVITETWLKNEMYCPACGCNFLTKNPNNAKMADFFCSECGEIYELKSTSHKIGKTIIDGAYSAAIERITSNKNLNLFILHYNKNIIENFILTPKYFFTPDIIKVRNPLSKTAQRAGYVGCNILFDEIPQEGKINVVKSKLEEDKKIVIEKYSQSLKLKTENINSRTWLIDIIKCVGKITHEIFTLKEMYTFTPELAKKHQDNHNIEAKIRQQLQFLIKKGFIERIENGVYRKKFYGE